MSSSNLDRARDMYAAWNEGNVESLVEFWWEDGTWEDAPEMPDRRVVCGRENVRAHLREAIEVMGDLRMEVIDLHELDGYVLGSVQVRVIGSTSGINIDTPSYHLIRFEEGRVRRYRTFNDREQALAAAQSG